MDLDFCVLLDHGIWELLPHHIDANILSFEWVFALNIDNKSNYRVLNNLFW